MTLIIHVKIIKVKYLLVHTTWQILNYEEILIANVEWSG